MNQESRSNGKSRQTQCLSAARLGQRSGWERI
jgi:hypothetical protein